MKLGRIDLENPQQVFDKICKHMLKQNKPCRDEKEDFDKLQNEKKEIELYHKLRNKYKDSVEATIHEGISGIE